MELDRPQDIYDAAVQLKTDGKHSFNEYIEKDQFLVRSKFRDQITFGYNEDSEDDYNILIMKLEKEIIGKRDPKLKETENTHVKLEFYKSTLSNYNDKMDSRDVLELLNKKSNEMEKVEDAWYHGYRLEPLNKTLEDLFDLPSGTINT